jgi:hypothetical protein
MSKGCKAEALTTLIGQRQSTKTIKTKDTTQKTKKMSNTGVNPGACTG